MKKDISTILQSEITLPDVVQEKVNLAFEEIQNKEHDNMKKANHQKVSLPPETSLHIRRHGRQLL